ncbi:hypothetical protein [Methanolobus sp.]|uniref:hypothetical protein n=1 Tax=Methanolobus sp. TaxID=1874737 RepID=UPI0025EA46C7|nr:hypothetical protein [Methanolobus sp.]
MSWLAPLHKAGQRIGACSRRHHHPFVKEMFAFNRTPMTFCPAGSFLQDTRVCWAASISTIPCFTPYHAILLTLPIVSQALL